MASILLYYSTGLKFLVGNSFSGKIEQYVLQFAGRIAKRQIKGADLKIKKSEKLKIEKIKRFEERYPLETARQFQAGKSKSVLIADKCSPKNYYENLLSSLNDAAPNNRFYPLFSFFRLE